LKEGKKKEGALLISPERGEGTMCFNSEGREKKRRSLHLLKKKKVVSHKKKRGGKG